MLSCQRLLIGRSVVIQRLFAVPARAPREQEEHSIPQPPSSVFVAETIKPSVGGSEKLEEWREAGNKPSVSSYLKLSKHRLSILVAVTALSGSAVAPVPVNWLALVACTAGTTLMSASANSINQYLESPYDAQMRRTQNRVLVTRELTPMNALSFAALTSMAGSAVLWFGCNPLTCGLGILNLVLYTAVYTPMKRYHIGCTWAGAVVGAIPPLMGYAALTGSLDSAAFVLAGILFSWQFPHFNGLSWNLREDYSRAGHSIALVGLCSIAAPLTGLSTWTFALNSLPVNAALLYFSFRFFQNPDSKSSRSLFRYSLLHLPLVMLLLAICQYGVSDPKSVAVVSVADESRLPPGRLAIAAD